VKSPIILGHFTKYPQGGARPKISKLLFLMVYQVTGFLAHILIYILPGRQDNFSVIIKLIA